MFYIAEAMEQAMNSDDFTGEGIKKAMYKKENWVPKGLEGVCLPSTSDKRVALVEGKIKFL